LSGDADDGFERAVAPMAFQFPRDHGPHPSYRTEWWYYTGNLENAAGRRFGFQLTFFRSQISPDEPKNDRTQQPSAWRTRQIYLAHAAVSDLKAEKFYHDERMSRGVLGIAGAELRGDTVEVFVANWSLRLGPQQHRLKAAADRFAFDLALVPEKPPVLHGQAGYSRKGSKPESSSCYYSFTRLAVTGGLRCGDVSTSVIGTAWMDHEYSSAPLEPDLVGWDWFSLQLSDRTEIMIYLLRNKQGGYSGASAGSFVDASGGVTHLERDGIEVEVLAHWESPHSEKRYPAKWRLTLPSLGLSLLVTPNMADQEMLTPESALPSYWEGSVSAVGNRRDRRLTGSGYVELTGYARAFDAPL
jgi:predicted secreted hydrolase